MIGKQVELFVVNRTPSGLTSAEIMSWMGSTVSARTSDLAELRAPEKVERPGVHFRLGEDECVVGDTQCRCYIGEAVEVATQLRAHVKEEPFWNQAVVVTSNDTNPTKSHVRYFESRLLAFATQPDGWFDDPFWSGGRNV